MTQKLKPCPFCGGEDFKAGADLENGVRGYVECKECGANIRFAFEGRVNAAMVVEAWNRRAEESADKDFIDSRFLTIAKLMKSITN